MNKERIEELIYKFYDKNLTDEEKLEFELALQTFDEARKMFHDRNFINQSLRILALDKNKPNLNISEKRTKYASLKRWLINTAAIISIPLIMGVSYLFLTKEEATPIAYNEVVATNAKVVTIILPDGSKATLYAGSSIKYPNVFKNGERLIQLDGEATFEVKSDIENPFYVENLDGTRVKAYGTKFSVRNYEDDKTISVYLERGIVDFENKSLRYPVTIKPDTKLTFNKNTKKYTIVNTTPNEYDAYEQGILIFNNKPLEEVIQRLKKVFRTNIIIESESIKEYRFTATFTDESIYQILDMLKESSPQLEWKKENSEIILYKKGTLRN
ncbi:DUF4974 domain-containing protein [Dysgonomonas sp. Marseille-P4677]|uniref:FecR family protein n=1 Tax=Dysgonomonas sp. Marseille-P4677 TaxID=2364790 RepID=UPI0019145280|nr:FecR domain-containing protein [Dysgonomonas sp. Marseille-P4677]MBK5721205.1 DUF4974 domain-containing protein [Dysgonomonas sp. Marseille-P4677]